MNIFKKTNKAGKILLLRKYNWLNTVWLHIFQRLLLSFYPSLGSWGARQAVQGRTGNPGAGTLLSPPQSPSLLCAVVLLLTGALRHLQGSAHTPPPAPDGAHLKDSRTFSWLRLCLDGGVWDGSGLERPVPCGEGLLTIQSWTLELGWGCQYKVWFIGVLWSGPTSFTLELSEQQTQSQKSLKI